MQFDRITHVITVIPKMLYIDLYEVLGYTKEAI